MGGVDGMRCSALFPHLQSDYAVGEIRCRRAVHQALFAATREVAGQMGSCAVVGWRAKTGGVRRGAGRRLPAADRGSRASKGADVGPIRQVSTRSRETNDAARQPEDGSLRLN